MRLSYVFTVVLVAILQASATAHHVYEDSNQVVSADAGGAAKVDVRRFLRGVENNIAPEDEERFFKKLGKYLKNIPQKLKDDWKVKKAKEQLERSRKRRQWIREQEDLEYLKESYEEVPAPLTSAGLFPSSEQMEEFAKQLPGITDFADIVDKYVMLARLDGDYFMCNHQDMKDAATLLRDTELTLSDRFTFCMSPVSLRNPLARKVFLEYARAHSLSQSVKLDIYLPKYPPRTAEALGDVEIKAKIIDLYLWLSFRFEETFVEKDLALELKTRVLELVEQGLVNTTYNREEKKTRWVSGAANGRRSSPRGQFDVDRFRKQNRDDKNKQTPRGDKPKRREVPETKVIAPSVEKESDEVTETTKSWISRMFGH